MNRTWLPNFPPHGLEMRASHARWRPARFTRSRKLLLFVLLHLFSNLFSSIDFAATTSALVSSSFNLDSREDVKAHMSFFYSKSPPSPPKTEVLLKKRQFFSCKTSVFVGLGGLFGTFFVYFLSFFLNVLPQPSGPASAAVAVPTAVNADSRCTLVVKWWNEMKWNDDPFLGLIFLWNFCMF